MLPTTAQRNLWELQAEPRAGEASVEPRGNASEQLWGSLPGQASPGGKGDLGNSLC